MCPPVITPGEFFVCTADIPRGSDVQFMLEMEDDIDWMDEITETGWMEVPQQWMHIPGGPLKVNSWNKTAPGLLDAPASPYTEDNYIISSTYFQYQANLTAIEYVPVTKGKLLIDILAARCPPMKNATGVIVETWWCPLTGACEEFCYSALQFQNDWYSEWGAEWECKGDTLDFCTLEGMCNYKASCPLSPTFVFGGSSVLPHAPKNITSLDETESVMAQWDYKINKTFEVTVTTAQLWKLQTLDIWRSFFYDPEREQWRKDHKER